MRALIDGDIIAFHGSAGKEEDGQHQLALWQCDQLIKRVIEDTQSEDYQIFISGDENFRIQLYPEYKANRKGKPRPRYVEDCKAFFVEEHGARVTFGYEADDALGIALTGEPDTILCSVDKDLKQVPGDHYNWSNREFDHITPERGWYNFYSQVLIGDPGDNVPGCPKVGKVRAHALLWDVQNDTKRMHELAKEAYLKNGKTEADFDLTCRLIYVLRHETDEWTPPT